MKQGTSLSILLAIVISFCAWQTKQTTDLKKAAWLIGTWVNNTGKESLYETWTKTNNQEYSGKSYVIKGNDTIVFETMSLLQEPAGLFYIPTVKAQNDSVPVRFAVKTISGTTMVFENAEHDFPQIISYKKINSDSLLAEIAGTKNGKQRKQSFPMKRKKQTVTENR